MSVSLLLNHLDMNKDLVWSRSLLGTGPQPLSFQHCSRVPSAAPSIWLFPSPVHNRHWNLLTTYTHASTGGYFNTLLSGIFLHLSHTWQRWNSRNRLSTAILSSQGSFCCSKSQPNDRTRLYSCPSEVRNLPLVSLCRSQHVGRFHNQSGGKYWKSKSPSLHSIPDKQLLESHCMDLTISIPHGKGVMHHCLSCGLVHLA